ncbi:MAG: SH3 domain-containing protein [Acidimicrobiia bacterium]
MDWVGTHRVPDGGTRAWAEPHPEAAELARVEGGLAVRVVEERGAWARIETATGTAAWVDGRRLEQAPQWRATHRVPADGTRAWVEPHPDAEELTRLPGSTEVRLTEERGAWAQVETEGGHHSWVDGRRLLATGPQSVDTDPGATVAAVPQPAPQPTPVKGVETPAQRVLSATAPAFGAVPLLGAGILVMAAGFPWMRPILGNADGWDLPLAFAFDVDAGSSVISYALALIVLAAGGLILGHRVDPVWRRIAGAVAIVLALAAVWQLMGFAADLSGQGRFDVIGDVFGDALHVGPYLAVVGGLGMFFGK